MKTPEVKPNKQRIISNLAPPSNLPSETREIRGAVPLIDPQQMKPIRPFQQPFRPQSAVIPSHVQISGMPNPQQIKTVYSKEVRPEMNKFQEPHRPHMGQNPSVNKQLEFETPIAPQLKKTKLTEGTIDKDQLKKIFGFEVHEIKKSGSNKRSTERAPLIEDKNLQMSNSVTNKKSHVNYYGRGYHLNYPNYQG